MADFNVNRSGSRRLFSCAGIATWYTEDEGGREKLGEGDNHEGTTDTKKGGGEFDGINEIYSRMTKCAKWLSRRLLIPFILLILSN